LHKYFVMRQIYVVILVILLAVVPACKKFSIKGLFGRKAKSEALLKARQDSTRIADSIQEVKMVLEKIENEKIDSLRKMDQERLVRENNLKYKIIVGCFLTPEYAENLAETYRNKGFDSKTYRRKGSRFQMVEAAAFDNVTAATKHLKEFRQTTEPGAWLYVKK
jgi:hypothetical protein